MSFFTGGGKTKYDVQEGHKSWTQPLSLTNLYKILDKGDLGLVGLCTFMLQPCETASLLMPRKALRTKL